MAKFFKIIGFLGLGLLAIYVIWDFVLLMKSAEMSLKVSETAGKWWHDFIFLLVVLLIGSGACILIIYYAFQTDNQPARITAYNNYQKQKRALAKVFSDAPKKENDDEEEMEEKTESFVEKEVPNNRDFDVRLSDISIDQNMISIKGTSFNIDVFGVSDLLMNDETISFVIAGRNYRISFINQEEAKQLYEFLRKYEH